MLRKLMIVVVVVAAAAGGLYWLGGLRVSMDGSGMIPRFVSTRPDFDALEADRARQRELPPIPGPAPVEGAPSAAPSSTTDPAATPGAARLELAVADRPAEVAPRPGVRVRSEWPDFRGPNRDGRYDQAAIRTSWPSGGLPLLWKQPIGPGYASFSVGGGRAFTIEQRRQQEVVAAYDVATGRELWTDRWDGDFREALGGDGPRATPTYHDGRVYALGALGELRSLDAATGRVLWRRNILEENGAANLEWGMSGAPLVVDDKVIVQPGGPRGRSVVAYDRLTGAEIWHALDDRQAYTSPMVLTLAGMRQLVLVTASRAVGLTVDEGRLLWEYPWANTTGINVAQPLLLEGDRLFLSASYGGGAAVLQVQRQGDAFTASTVWENNRMKNKFTSSVLHGGYIYGLDESILACVDAATGELKWKGGRYGYGQLMIAGDRLIVLTEDGDLVQVRATPDGHEELARFHAIDGKSWNHPIIADGRLLVRNIREMAAFDIRPAGN
jgi:outer membrane protein assembly factor BamB